MKQLRLLAFLLVGVALFITYAPTYVEKSRNQITFADTKPEIPAEIQTLHKSLFIADLHTDSLLWDRNLAKKANYGHVDIPRLIEGNVALQIFSVVTKTPKNLNIHLNTDQTDDIRLLALVQAWPPRTWFSLLARATYQAKKLQRVASKLPDSFYLLQDQQDLTDYLQQRKSNPAITAGILSLEGAHALEGKIENLDRLYAAGFRIIGFSHFFDAELGGSAHGLRKSGITEFGRKVLTRMNELDMFIDLAHASPKLMQDVFTLSSRPILVTHTGVQETCASPRNLSNQQIKQIAQTEGLIGIGFWHGATCTNDISGTARAIRHVVDLVGIDYVALGSDFDGNVRVPFTAADMQQLTLALVNADFTEVQIRKIMGENQLRLFSKYLPKN